jgi:hypothetical protein
MLTGKASKTAEGDTGSKRCRPTVSRRADSAELRILAEGLEPSTSGSVDQCSVQLSYASDVHLLFSSNSPMLSLQAVQLVPSSVA